MLKIKDKWIWDFWFAQEGKDFHVFFLQAPKSLQDPALRHFNVSVGHAVSQDLSHWKILADAIAPGPPGAWDDMSTWTGSIVQYNGQWHMFYTGASSREKGLVQRIGLAVSEDLIHWEKFGGNPFLEADPRWYEQLDLTKWHDQAWRDPWVFFLEEDAQFHAFITARSNQGPADQRGVIGHARSIDLFHWEVLPPVSEPGDFGHLEVPQLIPHQSRYYLLFSCPVKYQSERWLNRRGNIRQSGTHYLISRSPTGPYQLRTEDFMVGDAQGSLYSGKIIQDAAGDWVFLGFLNYDSRGNFIGELSDPMPVAFTADYRIEVDWQPT